MEGKNDSALSAELLVQMRHLALQENGSDPQHNYFIGLAYLAGIDVEINHARALELIRSAAERNYAPAMVKLVNMYRTGEGVARDYNTAIQWQQRLVNDCRQRWENKASEDNFEKYTHALWNLGNYYEELQDLKNWRFVWQEKMLTLCEAVWKERGFTKAQYCQAVSYNNLGDICTAEGNLAGSRSYYKRETELFKKLADESPTLENRRGLAISYERMGGICQAQGDLAGSRSYYKQETELFKELAEESPTLGNRHGLAISYERMGGICQAQGDLAGSRSYYEQESELFKELVKETLSPQTKAYLAISYCRLGITGGVFPLPLQKSLEIWQQLVKKYPNVSVYREFRDIVQNILKPYHK